MKYAKRTKYFNKLLGKNLKQVNLRKLEGIQQGLKSFADLSLKQIVFALSSLHSINFISGCTNNCLHCYANAQPFIKRYPYEDFVQILHDIGKLHERIGISYRKNRYIDPSFDVDALDVHLFDKDGNKHDYIEIAKTVKETTGCCCVFDTNGWSLKDTKKQAIAEEYVSKLLKQENRENFLQINISVNPFNPKYVKSLNLGYKPSDYGDLISQEEDKIDKSEALLTNEYKLGRKLYSGYIEDVVNTLYTFTPLTKTDKLGIIIRCFNDNVDEMKGFRIKDFKITLQNILNTLRLKYISDIRSGKMTKASANIALNKYQELFLKIDPQLSISGRLEKFYKHRNPKNFEKINWRDFERLDAKENFELLKKEQKMSVTKLRYLRMVAPDGRVYLYDNYKIIPTDIKLNTSTDKVEKPFSIPIENFVVTEKMIDRQK